ncbi:MAG: fused MFS/spermidine synthase [Egibacteraceae bacterium]
MPSLLAGLLVFATSAAVLVLEILAGRILAPYVGDTLQTYTGIIGTVLAGIAVGTWLGGRLADRRPPRTLLGPTIVLGGVLTLLVLPVIALFGPQLAGREVSAIILLAFLGVFAPAAVLSAVTPTVVKLQLADLDETGTVVGRLSALGTAGAIVGTFLTGFVLLAAFPTRPIVLAIGGGLIVAGAALWWWLGAGRAPAALAAAVLAALALAAWTPVPCEIESAYFCAQVIEDPERASGRILKLDALPHSYVDLADPTHLEFAYTIVLDAVINEHAGNAPRLLHLGGGAFTLPRHAAATRPDATNVVVEVDPALVDLARQEFDFAPEREGVEVVVDDARLDVAERPAGRYDAVLGDAFGGLAVPWHLTTAEFLADVDAALAPGGVYAVNVIDHPPYDFAHAQAATLRAVFDEVALAAPPAWLDGQAGGNAVLVAGAELDPEGLEATLAARGLDWRVRHGAALDTRLEGAMVLTDDHAPVDQLLTTQTTPRALRPRRSGAADARSRARRRRGARGGSRATAPT